MVKRERVPIKLFVDNGASKAKLSGNYKVASSKTIIELLDQLKKSGKIVKSKKIKKDNFIDYVYDVNEETNYSIIIRVNNDEKDKHYETIKYLETLCDLSISLKKVNRNRFAAGLAIGTLILVVAGPTIAKTIKENDEAYSQQMQKQYEEFLENTGYYEPHYPTESEIKQREEEERKEFFYGHPEYLETEENVKKY